MITFQCYGKLNSYRLSNLSVWNSLALFYEMVWISLFIHHSIQSLSSPFSCPLAKQALPPFLNTFIFKMKESLVEIVMICLNYKSHTFMVLASPWHTKHTPQSSRITCRPQIVLEHVLKIPIQS